MDSGTVYGQEGEEVKLIKDCGPVLIVEGAKERFPVSVVLVTAETVEPVIDTKPIINQVPAAKKPKSKSAPQNQANLFL